MIALSVIVTLAPATSAPCGSVTVPTILPVLIVVCAHTTAEDRRRSANVANAVKGMATRPRQFEIGIIGLPFMSADGVHRVLNRREESFRGCRCFAFRFGSLEVELPA